MNQSGLTLYLQGGLGNQLFQACFYSYVKNNLSVRCLVDPSLLNFKIRGVTPRAFETQFLFDERDVKSSRSASAMKARLVRKRLSRRLYIEDPANVSRWKREVFKPTRDVLGYFQDHSLVAEQWAAIQDRFREEETWRRILDCPLEDRIVVHYRLGDYVTNSSAQSFHGVTHPQFFYDAINEIDPQGNRKVHLVTDSDGLARRLLTSVGLDSSRIMSSSSNQGHLEDLATLSNSTNVITSNSSFSWWGGWIAQQKGATVVAPEPWFSSGDESPPIIPPSWKIMKRPILSSSDLVQFKNGFARSSGTKSEFGAG